MSVFVTNGGAASAILKKIDGTSAVEIAGKTDRTVVVPWLQCTEIAGATPTLKVEINDGTSSFYLHNAQVNAGDRIKLEDIVIPAGNTLKVTVSAADKIDVTGVTFVQPI